MHVLRRSWNFFEVYYFCCVEFLCILFSRIFSMCPRLLGLRPQPRTPTRALPLDLAGGLPSPDPSFLPRCKFLATPLIPRVRKATVTLTSNPELKLKTYLKQTHVEYKLQRAEDLSPSAIESTRRPHTSNVERLQVLCYRRE